MSSGTPSAEDLRKAVQEAKRRAGKLARRAGVYDSLAKARLAGRRPSMPSRPAAVESRVRGMVETATASEIVGWVAVPPPGSAPVRVSLHLQGVEVGATWASTVRGELNSWGEVRTFRFQLRDVWLYARKSDKLVVRADGKALPILGCGMFVRPVKDGTREFSALQERLASGHIFSSTGKLQLSKSLDTQWQGKVLGLYDKVRVTLEETYGYEAFVMYGSMLGAIREGGFIGHDFDFDAAFVSRHNRGPAAAEEMKQIAFTLIDRGLDVECKWSALHLHDAEQPATRIDLFHLFFDGEGVLRFPFGAAGVCEIREEDWKGTHLVPFAGREVLAPVNAEQFVETLYGPGWRQPQPGFDWDRERTVRARQGLIPPASQEEVYWANFYARTEYTSGSTFFDFVDAREDTPGSVIDIGCGDGRDAFAFGVAGRRVLGLDRSHIGVRHAAKKAGAMGFGDRVRFQGCDVGDDASVRAALTGEVANSPGSPVLFYARFFLHSITEETQEILMAAIRDVARPGDMFAAEFRTDKDEPNAKVHTKHFRRFQNGPAFGVRLVHDYGFDVLFEQEGTGLSPYKGEDPELYRVLARRAARADG